tara:strand:- start:5901 stop:8717 length:2817 start_codon:yes stop_codon:yes gene_type:complete
MKKITIKKIFVFFAFVFMSNIAFTQITTNLTGLPGDDLIFFEDTRFFKAFGDASPGASGITVKAVTVGSLNPGGVTLNASNQILEGTGSNLSNFTYPLTTIPDNGPVNSGATVAVRLQGNTGSANETSDVWIIVNSVDLSAYDGVGGSKYFTFHSRSSFYENGADKTDDTMTIAYTTNFTTGADPELATWTEIDMNTVTTVASSDDLGADGKWTTNQLNLSNITAGTGFAMRIRRQVSANGPDGTGVYSTDNRNGTFNFTNPTFTGTEAPPLLINVAAGDFSALNTSSTSQANIFNTPTASIDNNNFSNTSKWAAIFDAADGSVPRLVNGALAPVGEGYKFEVAAGYNPIVVSEVRYKFVNGASNQGAPDGSIWIVQGSNDDTIWDDLSDPFQFFTSNTGSSEFSIPLISTKAYRYFRFVLSTAWTPSSNFTALQQLDFTVAALWTGVTDSDWDTTTNWNTNALPIASHDAIIPSGITNYPTGTTPVSVNSLTIESGASFMTSSTVTGNVTYKRNLSFTSGNLEGWHLVGAPVVGQAFGGATTWLDDNNIASGTGSNRGVATYDNSVASNNWNYSDGTASSFATATGYSVKTSATTDISFTGTMNTDPVNKAITIGAGTPFNLISNPFVSYINSETFLDLAANSTKLTSKTIWVWNPTTKNYDAKISTEAFKVAPGQAFFVSCSTAGDLTFEEGIQSHQTTDTFLKGSSKPEIQLNITNGDLNRYAKVFYNENATTGFDNGYDGETFSGVSNNFDVFTQLLENNLGKNYQIQSLPNTDLEAMVIPVGVKAIAGKEITFSAQAINLPNGVKVFLEDRTTNTITRLDEANTSYKVTLSDALNGTGRFYLHTKASSVLSTNDVDLQNISVYTTNNATLKVVGLTSGTSNLKVFNILGKQVLQSTFISTGVKEVSLPKLATGVYIVQLTTETGKLNKKIILE